MKLIYKGRNQNTVIVMKSEKGIKTLKVNPDNSFECEAEAAGDLLKKKGAKGISLFVTEEDEKKAKKAAAAEAK